MPFVVSFTTSPTRIHLCYPMILGFLRQSVAPDKIILNIPEVFERTQERYQVPKEIAEMVEINVCSRDWGPATKLVPTIEYLREKEYPENTRILYCDDDIYYPPTLIETLKNTNDTYVWTNAGFHIINYKKIVGERAKFTTCSVAEGFGGVCVTLRMFPRNRDFITYMEACIVYPELRLSDDIILSNYFSKLGITIVILPQTISVLQYGTLADALHNGANGITTGNVDRYQKAFQRLIQLRGMFLKVKMTPSQYRIRLF